MSRFLQVVLALVGLLISGVMGLVSQRSESLQSRHALLALFGQSISVARTTCDLDMTFVAEDALARIEELENTRWTVTSSERAQNLDSLEKYRDNLGLVRNTITGGCVAAPAAVAATNSITQAAPGDAPAIDADDAVRSLSGAEPPRPAAQEQAQDLALRSLASQSENLALRSALTASPQRGNGKFFVVLASYAIGDESTYDSNVGAVAHYTQLVSATRSANVPVQVFRTRISRHFAIALGPTEGMTRDAARELVGRARSEGWAQDAFVQEERGWTHCDNPGSNESLRACAQ